MNSSGDTKHFSTALVGFFTVLLGGQFMYMYSLKRRSWSIQSQKEKLQSKKQVLQQREKEQYEQKIADLQSQLDRYKVKYDSLKDKYNQLLANKNQPLRLEAEGGVGLMRQVEEMQSNITRQLESFTQQVIQQVNKEDKVQPDEIISRIEKALSSGPSQRFPRELSKSKDDDKDRFDPNFFMQQQIKNDLQNTKSSVNLHKLCITGGPCAGKTTALAVLQMDLQQLGFVVLTVPEAATLLMKGGAMIVSSSFTKYQGLKF